MRRETPVILYAFANDPTRPLRLADEERAIRKAFANARDNRQVVCQPLGHTTLEDIYYNFNRYHNRITIFHYGGHSDQQFLNLEDVNSRAGSLSRLIGMQKELKLVFLNGCGNQAHVDALFKQGVKAVIATSTSIEDQRAQQFAHQFYNALANGKSIIMAFETAASFMGHQDPDVSIEYRGIVLGHKEKDQLPWGLYAQKEADLEWVLPTAIPVPEDVDLFQEIELNIPDVNEKLVEFTFQGMADHHKKYKAFYELYQDDPLETTLNDLQILMLRAFPSILSNQIRDLFTMEGSKLGRVRLKELNEVYLTLIRMLSSIALSNLWDVAVEMQEKYPETGLIIRREYLEEYRQFLDMPYDELVDFDHLWLVATVSRTMLDNEIEPYVKELIELNQGFREANEYYEGYRFLETQLRQRLRVGDIATDEIEALCIEAEEHLGHMLQKCAFLCNYQLVSVKGISVVAPRPSSQPTYIHSKAILRGSDYEMMDRKPIQRQSFTSNNSIFITRNIQDEHPPLNLSPFLIDESSFRNKKDYLPKIYFYNGRKEGDPLYQHAEILHNNLLLSEQYDKQKYHDLEIILEQLKFFRQIIGI